MQQSLIQEILKWFAGACLLAMAAFIAYGWVKGLYMEAGMKTKRKQAFR